MAVLVWKHGTSRAAAREVVVSELRKLGHYSKVTWEGDSATSSLGWGAVLSVSDEVTDEAVVLEKCGGAVSGMVLGKCREMLERLFPGGEQA